ATSARVDGPGTAEAEPITAENAENRADAAQIVPEVVKDAAPVAAEGPAGEAVDAEEAEYRHRALMLARIRLSSAPAVVKERFASVAETAKDAAAVEACLKAVEEALPDFL